MSSCRSVRMNLRKVQMSAGSVIRRMNSSKYAVAAITSSIEFCRKTRVIKFSFFISNEDLIVLIIY